MIPRRVLVLYTGGTIGMSPGPRGWTPSPGLLSSILRENRALHTGASDDGGPLGELFTLPTDVDGLCVTYTVLEQERLVDSANMGPADWVRIADELVQHQDAWDGFVVLHGTDTMAYTASALSFMLAGLSKPVILTGSQIPLLRVRNDALPNLIGSLVLAARRDIPEVGLYFHDALLRGNRARKVDASGLNAYVSGNLRPLATVGIDIHVARELVRPPESGPLRVDPITTTDVACVRWFPGLTARTLDAILRPPLRGVILETYGSGNAPDQDPEIHRVLRRATDDGITIGHVTQCQRGAVRTDYAAARALADAGVISGADMTAEAALTKLMWLLSHAAASNVRTLFSRDLRGELTEVST